MTDRLTEQQKELLKWIVDKIRNKYLNEEFIISWVNTKPGFQISDNQGKKVDLPESLTKGMLAALEKLEVILCEPQYLTSRSVNKEYRRDCTILGKAYELVDSNFETQDTDLKKILLEKSQEELLCNIVEASRNLPLDKRKRFVIVRTDGGDLFQHPELKNGEIQVYMTDITTLENEKLLSGYPGGYNSSSFDITPKGFKYYEKIKREGGQPIKKIEKTIIDYLNAMDFKNKYKLAYQKWSDAEKILWQSDTENQLTTIGHFCREAMQEFATTLVQNFNPPDIDEDKARIKNRLKSVIYSQSKILGKKITSFLTAIIDYWETISDLVQRQEHGATKKGESLVWEDGRRIVFHTAIVMLEVDKTLTRMTKIK